MRLDLIYSEEKEKHNGLVPRSMKRKAQAGSEKKRTKKEKKEERRQTIFFINKEKDNSW